ncbi:hypothetical protein Tco_1295457 [Tanacetum coccineum]
MFPVPDSSLHCAFEANPVDGPSLSWIIKQVWKKEQTQPEYLQELLQSLLKDLQILNEIQPLKQETLNQIQKDQEEKSISELLAEERLQKANQVLNESQSPQEMRIQDLEIQKQQCLEEMKEWMNDLGIREYQKVVLILIIGRNM